MDAADDNPGGLWTNERHMRYLRSMEASFVRTTFGDEDNGRLLRLDRYMPDSSESTLDLKKNDRIRRHSTSEIPEQGIRSRSGDKKTRRLSFQPHNSSQDQVVPQLEFRIGGEDVRGHSGRLPAAPAN